MDFTLSTARHSARMARTLCSVAKSTDRQVFRNMSLVGPVGIEPTTCGLKVRCSTAELEAHSTLD